jgi:hypothetical protein
MGDNILQSACYLLVCFSWRNSRCLVLHGEGEFTWFTRTCFWLNVHCATRVVANLGPIIFLRMEALELELSCMSSQICSHFLKLLRQETENL